MEDLNDKVTGGTLTASEWNQVPSEIQNVITQTNQSLSLFDLDQLGKAIAAYVGSGTFYLDSGGPNAYVLNGSGLFQTPPQYYNGMLIRFVPFNTNTGDSTVNVAGLGIKPIRDRAGTVLASGTIIAGQIVLAAYDVGSDQFKLTTLQTVGTVTSVTAGLGLIGSGPASDPVLDVGGGSGISVDANNVNLDNADSRNTNHSLISVIAGTGLSGGGALTSSVQLNINAGSGLFLSGDTVAVGAGNGISVSASTIGMSGAFTGTFSATGDVIAFASDETVKENIKPIVSALDKVNSLRSVTFSWSDEALEAGAEDQPQVGLIAQEVKKILPEAVRQSAFMSGKLTVSYLKVVPLLVAAINELTDKVNELEKKLC